MIGLYFGNLGKKFVFFKILARYRKSRISWKILPRTRRDLRNQQISWQDRWDLAKTFVGFSNIMVRSLQISARWRISCRDLTDIWMSRTSRRDCVQAIWFEPTIQHQFNALPTDLYQANWELVTLWVCNVPTVGDTSEYMKDHNIWTAEKDIKTWLIIAVTSQL